MSSAAAAGLYAASRTPSNLFVMRIAPRHTRTRLRHAQRFGASAAQVVKSTTECEQQIHATVGVKDDRSAASSVSGCASLAASKECGPKMTAAGQLDRQM